MCLFRRNSSGPQKHLRHSLPLAQTSTGVEKNHAKTPYERRSPSVPTPRSASHQPPTPAATPGSPAVLTPNTTVASSSPGTSGVTPPVRQRKRRNNESAEAGPSSSGSTTPSTSRTRSGQPASNGNNSSLHSSPPVISRAGVPRYRDVPRITCSKTHYSLAIIKRAKKLSTKPYQNQYSFIHEQT